MDALPIIPWIGGKRRLASHIIPLFPEHSCYVEPFAGAAALLFAKQPSKVEVINDVNGDLVNLYRCVQHHLEEFVRQFKWALTSREIFRWLQITPRDVLTDIQRAARFYYLQHLAFGGKVEGQSFGTSTTNHVTLNLLRIEETLSAAHLRLARVMVERLDWSKCIERYDRPHTLFFMDPPYWQTAGYGTPFPREQYTSLAETMRSMRGKAILTINDVEAMREAFRGLSTRRVSIKYSVGRDKSTKPRGELIVMNWR